MPRLFDSYFVVTWSAASKPNTGNDSVWIAAQTPDARMKLQNMSVNPDTRAKAAEQLIAAIGRLLKRGDRVFLGLGFPLGFPEGTASALGLKAADTPDWKLLQNFVAKEIKDKPDNTNNRFALAARMNRLMTDGPFPFWGCQKKDELTTLPVKKSREHVPEDLPEFRVTETVKPASSSSVWKLSYGSATGGLALTGLPLLAKLREAFGESMAIWPFETGFTDLSDLDAQLIIAEVSPESVAKTVPSGNHKTQKVTESLAESIAERDSKGLLMQDFDQPERVLGPDILEKALQEGWILGK